MLNAEAETLAWNEEEQVLAQNPRDPEN